MGNDRIQKQEEQHAAKEADGGGYKGKGAVALGAFNGGNEQGPDRGGDHHSGGKPKQGFLQNRFGGFPENKNGGGTEGSAQEGKKNAAGRLQEGIHGFLAPFRNFRTV